MRIPDNRISNVEDEIAIDNRGFEKPKELVTLFTENGAFSACKGLSRAVIPCTGELH